MWVVGTLIVLAIGAAVSVVIGWKPRATPSPPLWDVASLSGTYTGIAGTLSGFSVASATFIAGLDAGRENPAFAAVIGMMLISFLILIATTMMFGSTPNVVPVDGYPDAIVQNCSHLLASACYYLGLSISWLALGPLLDLIDLAGLADVLTWLLLTVAIAGSARIAVVLYRLTTASGLACAAVPVLGFGLPTVYWFFATRVWPVLWPASNIELRFAVVVFAVTALGFTVQTWLLVVHGNARVRQRLQVDGYRFALAYAQVAVISVGLVWIAVATS